MVEFEILARGLYRPDQLIITYDPALRISLDAAMQEWMDALWEQKLAAARENNIPLFDAPLFRLARVEAHAGGILRLLLGDTSYKEYTTTGERRRSERDVGASGVEGGGVGPCGRPWPGTGRAVAPQCIEELSNPLAVCSVVETSDGYILYEQRQRVAVYAGRYHVIGGFFERLHDINTEGRPDPFAAMRRELREETGIQAFDIAEQYCLGPVYDLETPHGELCFLTRLSIALAEVHRRIPEDDEVQQLLALAATAEGLRAFILENHDNISVTGEANLLLYGATRFGESWFEEVLERLL